MLKVLHAPESRLAAQARAKDVVEALNEMKLKTAAQWVDAHIDETLACYAYHSEHWIKLQTNNPMERLLKEARRRTKVVGAFPDGKSALMPVAARPRHVASTVGKRGDIRI
jgi:transposase-like protein